MNRQTAKIDDTRTAISGVMWPPSRFPPVPLQAEGDRARFDPRTENITGPVALPRRREGRFVVVAVAFLAGIRRHPGTRRVLRPGVALSGGLSEPLNLWPYQSDTMR
jgi:hypothetical protein